MVYYGSPSSTRQQGLVLLMWAKVSDPIIALAAITGAVPHARSNPFTQIWKVATRGAKHKLLDNSIARMLKVANKYNVKIAALHLSTELHSQLPAWYHVSAHPAPSQTDR